MLYAYFPENLINLDLRDFWNSKKISINELQTTYKKFVGCWRCTFLLHKPAADIQLSN